MMRFIAINVLSQTYASDICITNCLLTCLLMRQRSEVAAWCDHYTVRQG